MSRKKLKGMPELRIGDFVSKIPIIQGGMGVAVSGIKLALAVAAEDALPTIATVEMGKDDPRWQKRKTKDIANADAFRAAITEFREKRPGMPLQANIMVAQMNYPETAAIATDKDHGVDIAIFGSALPTTLPEMVSEGSRTALVVIVSSAKAARIISKKWDTNYSRTPDAVIVEGPMAGGHLGFKDEAAINDPKNRLELLVPAVIAEIAPFAKKYARDIPVIAAGGVFTGADIYKYLRLGAAGVQLGTRFVPTLECDAAREFKQMYVNAKEEDLVIIDSPAKLPGRAIRNAFLETGKKPPDSCKKQCLSKCVWREAPYCIVEKLVNAQEGRVEEGLVFAGANAHRTKGIISVHDLIEELVQGYEEAEAKALSSK